MFNRTTLLILVVALAAGLGLWAAQRHFGSGEKNTWPETTAIRLL